MKNRMIAYEQKGNVPSLTPRAYSSSVTPFRNTIENNLCLAVGVTSMKKIMKIVLSKLRRVQNIKPLARRLKPLSSF
jgi:hypothetical protein